MDNDEIFNAAEALSRWFMEQEISPHNSAPVCCAVIASVIVASSQDENKIADAKRIVNDMIEDCINRMLGGLNGLVRI